MWILGVGSTFIVQLPVQPGGKVEPQPLGSRGLSVTFGNDAEVCVLSSCMLLLVWLPSAAGEVALCCWDDCMSLLVWFHVAAGVVAYCSSLIMLDGYAIPV